MSRIIGRVAMDMLTVDLTDLPETGVGSKVELWGRQVSVNQVAAAAGTIAYELLCHVKRVRREYFVGLALSVVGGCLEVAGRDSPRRATSFLARARKEAKNTPPRLRRCLGRSPNHRKPASWRLRGVPQNSLRAFGASFKQPRQVSSRCMGASTPMLTPQSPRRRRSLKGVDSLTRAIAALGLAHAGASASRCADKAERSNGPYRRLPVAQAKGHGQ